MFWKKEEEKPIWYKFQICIFYKNTAVQQMVNRGYTTEQAAVDKRNEFIRKIESAMSSGAITEIDDGVYSLGSEIIAFTVYEVTVDRYFYEYKQY